MCREDMVVYVLYTSDVHGHWSRVDGQSDGSMACAASYVERLRREQPYVWFIDNGDLLQGTPFANDVALHEGQNGADMLGAALHACGVDMVVPGNHDTDYGIDYLQQVIKASDCLWLAANIRHRTGTPLAPSYHIKSFGSRQVAFIGVTTRIPFKQYPVGWEIHDEVETVRVIVQQLRAQVDVIIVSYHGGLEADGTMDHNGENQALRMAAEVPGIDVILTGHQHGSWVQRVGSTLILQPGAFGASVGEIALQFSESEYGVSIEADGRIVDVTGQEEREEVLAVLRNARYRADERLNSTLCKIDPLLQVRDWHDLTRGEHPIVEWMHRLQLRVSGAELSAVAYAGSTKLPIQCEGLTRRGIQRIFPYMDRLGVYTIRGSSLRAALEVTASWYAEGDLEPHSDWLKPHLLLYQLAMFEGIEYTIDVSLPRGQRIVRCDRLGQAVRDTDTYSIVMTGYLAGQAAKYPMFRELELRHTLEDPVMSLMETDAKSQGFLHMEYTPNWSVIGGREK